MLEDLDVFRDGREGQVERAARSFTLTSPSASRRLVSASRARIVRRVEFASSAKGVHRSPSVLPRTFRFVQLTEKERYQGSRALSSLLASAGTEGSEPIRESLTAEVPSTRDLLGCELSEQVSISSIYGPSMTRSLSVSKNPCDYLGRNALRISSALRQWSLVARNMTNSDGSDGKSASG